MAITNILGTNLLSPIALSFGLGVLARQVRSEFTLPKDIYMGLAIFLLFALGLKGGVELAHAELLTIAAPVAVTLFLGCLTPITAYFILSRLGRFSPADAAGIAAHYGSVSAVTYMAAQEFVTSLGYTAEGYMPTLLALLESPGIQIALALGAIKCADKGKPTHGVLREVLTGQTMVLLVGGLVVGYLIGAKNWADIEPFYDTKGGIFKGALCLFLLEMGVVAGSRLRDLKKVGLFLLGFGILMPLLHGIMGVALGGLAGLSVGGCTILAAMASSASYIAAPPAVRVTLPEANPTFSLTCALAITLPFNLIVGIPVYYVLARTLYGT